MTTTTTTVVVINTLTLYLPSHFSVLFFCALWPYLFRSLSKKDSSTDSCTRQERYFGSTCSRVNRKTYTSSIYLYVYFWGENCILKNHTNLRACRVEYRAGNNTTHHTQLTEEQVLIVKRVSTVISVGLAVCGRADTKYTINIGKSP